MTPDQELGVARMLAESSGAEPIPDEVASRLQEVLDGLVAERAAGSAGSVDESAAGAESGGAEVTALRARRWPRALLAAAAVLVVGYGVGSVAGEGSLSGSGGGSGGGSTADSSVAGSAGSAEEAPESAQDYSSQDDSGKGDLDHSGLGTDSAGGTQSEPKRRNALDSISDLGRFPPRLRSERLDVGVRRALGVLEAQEVDGALAGYRSGTCRPPSSTKGAAWLRVRYDGRPAVLVSRPVEAERVEVTVYTCSGTELDRTVVQP